MKPTDILILTSTPLSRVAIAGNCRPVQLARQLDEAGFEVTLAIPNPEIMPATHFRVTASDAETLESLIRRHDTVISTGAEYTHRQISREDHYQTFDVADIPFEELTGEPTAEDRVSNILSSADLILCGSPFQRDFWLGMAAGRGAFAALRNRTTAPMVWFAVVPYGQPGYQLPEVENANGADHHGALTWNGGYSPMYDPDSAIQASVQLARAGHGHQLVFLPPTTLDADEASAFQALQERVSQIDSRDTSQIVFLPPETTAAERNQVLKRSRGVVCITRDTPDVRLWHAAPLVEAVWTKVPFVCTRGPFMSFLADELEIGFPTSPGDRDDIAGRIARLCEPEVQTAMRRNLDEVYSHFGWDRIMRPLLEFLQRPSQMVERMPEQPNHWGRSVWRAVGRLFE